MSYGFESDYSEVGHVPDVYSEHDIINEPMLFSAGFDFAMRSGGDITREVLRELMYRDPRAFDTAEGRHIVIDTRVHMLMPGFIPAIPGWHCDAWPRGENGQPNPDDTDGKWEVKHWTCCVAAENKGLSNLAPTLFLDKNAIIPIDPDNVWKSVSVQLQAALLPGEVTEAGNGIIYHFGVNQLHRATKAVGSGWRYFFRLSHYQHPPMNDIRTQVQVYTTEHGGW